MASLVHWPTETQANAFADLDAVRTHVGIAQPVLTAFTTRVGAVGNSIGLMASLPAGVVARALGAMQVVVTAATPQASAVTRAATL